VAVRGLLNGELVESNARVLDTQVSGFVVFLLEPTSTYVFELQVATCAAEYAVVVDNVAVESFALLPSP
jgi:hypothetical protein